MDSATTVSLTLTEVFGVFGTIITAVIVLGGFIIKHALRVSKLENQVNEYAQERKTQVLEINTRCATHTEKINQLEKDNGQFAREMQVFSKAIDEVKDTMKDFAHDMKELSVLLKEHIAFHKGKEEK